MVDPAAQFAASVGLASLCPENHASQVTKVSFHPTPVIEAAGSPVVGDLLGLLVPGKKARGTRICRHSSVNISINCASMTR